MFTETSHRRFLKPRETVTLTDKIWSKDIHKQVGEEKGSRWNTITNKWGRERRNYFRKQKI